MKNLITKPTKTRCLTAMAVIAVLAGLSAVAFGTVGYQIDYQNDPDAFLAGVGGAIIGGLIGLAVGYVGSIVAVCCTKLVSGWKEIVASAIGAPVVAAVAMVFLGFISEAASTL